MKNRLIATLMLAVMLLGVFAGCAKEKPLLTEEAALQIVLDDCGLTAEELPDLEIVLTSDAEAPYYTISFTGQNLPYTYTVNAKTGEILSYPEF